MLDCSKQSIRIAPYIVDVFGSRSNWQFLFSYDDKDGTSRVPGISQPIPLLNLDLSVARLRTKVASGAMQLRTQQSHQLKAYLQKHNDTVTLDLNTRTSHPSDPPFAACVGESDIRDDLPAWGTLGLLGRGGNEVLLPWSFRLSRNLASK